MAITSCSDEIRNEPISINENTSKTNSSSKLKNFIEADANLQFEANQKLEKIHAYFLNNTFSKNNSEIDYPDYYGGAFINNEGKLVVYIKGSINRYKKDIEDIIGSQNVIFNSCKNSYSDLNKTMKELNNYKFTNGQNSYSQNFNSYGIIDSENILIVNLNDFTDASMKQFKKNVNNSKVIEFRKGNGKPILQATDLNPGANIYAKVGTNNNNGSIGFRAKNSAGEEGIVTSGHVISEGQGLYYGTGTAAIGLCAVSKQSGSVDAAFIPIFESYNNIPTNTINGTTNTLSTLTSLPGSGTVVNKVGYKTGSTSGKVISTNFAVDYGVYGTITNVTTVNYNALRGDSGGIVYSYVSSTNTRYTVGIHGGQIDATTWYYIKAPNILSSLNLSRY